ncbi:DNA polymerase III subunit delta [Xanthocytophaga agilis]|uniref:DNA polymerase III subunit delta n=1 Tax=Xanthocytophaga agilis TaxID=3048010 RepID=A0AAE3RD93_9BACT|nr:DNA polymerase III subunit delta [Xanthocytophaga agilis]MDJ1506485.1 DNA polymerase III subunit delta [Xanthocytophaga agilis]
MLFKEIPGLADVKKTLIQSVQTGHIHHAQLFFGNEGSANLALAWAYATYVNCEDKQPDDACGVCPACRKIGKLAHPDLHQIFPVAATKKITKDPLSENFLPDWRLFLAGNPYASLTDWLNYIGTENRQPQISAEESRQIIQRLSLKPYEADYKVLFMWLPEMLNITSANALLKILEEPPPKTLFLLVCQDPGRLLTTIISRTQMVRVRSFTDQEISHVLTTKLQVEPQRAAQIAHLADGNLNEAIRLSNEVKNDQHELFRDWMRLCFQLEKRLTDIVKNADKLAAMPREAQKNVLQYGINMVRESLVYTYNEPQLIRLEGEEMTFVQGFAKVITPERAERLFGYFNNAILHLERNASPRIVFLDTSLQVASSIKG